jgi:DNA-binding response OmpR family regulator
MTEGSDGNKKQLGRILLQRKLVTADELEDLLVQQRTQGERLATTVAESGKVEASDLLSALSEQQGLPAVDLRRVVISLENLALVPVDIARQHVILPLLVNDDRLFLAMADPDNKRVIDELEFVTGKRIFPYVALHGAMRDVIEAAYAAAQAGVAQYAGPLADQDVDGEYERRPSMLPGRDVALVTGTPDGQHDLDDELSRPHLLPPSPLPAMDDAFQVPSTEEHAIPEPATKKRILVVDDSDDIRQLLTRVFRERDFEVFESARGLDALQKVRDHIPDVMVLDAMLPEVHGFDICRRIKGSRRYGHIPVIMVSAVYRGWRFAEDLRRSYGVDEFLEKPFRIGEVVAAVERALAGTSHMHGRADDEQDDFSGGAGEHLRAGIEAYSRGDTDTAIEHLKKGIGIDPLAFRLHYHLGLLYGKQDNVFEAIQALETAADLRPRDFSTLKNLAVLYQRAGFRLKATEMWERALGSAPDDDTRANIKSHLMSLL